MKKRKVFVVYIWVCVVCMVLFTACNTGEEASAFPPPSFAPLEATHFVPPSPSPAEPLPATPSPSPAPVVGPGDVERLRAFLDSYVRWDLDTSAEPLLAGYPPQDTVVEVFHVVLTNGVHVTSVRWELSGDKFSGQLDPTYMYLKWVGVANDTAAGLPRSPHTEELVTTFTYQFDPQATDTFQNQYFGRWLLLREEIIAYETQWHARNVNPGETEIVTLIFCEYTERYAMEPGDARVYYFVEMSSGYETFYYVDIDASGFRDVGNNVKLSDFNLDFYRSQEFDRAVICIKG